MENDEKRLAELRTILRRVTVVAWGAGITVFVWLALMHLRPTGAMNVRYHITPDERPSLVKGFASKEKVRIIGRLDDSEKYFQEITVDPVYFSVPTIRNWHSANVTVVYDNPDGQPILRLGAQTTQRAYAFQTLAAHDQRLEALRPYWQRIDEGNITLWQKNRAAYEAYVEKRKELERKRKTYEDLIADSGELREEDDEERTTEEGEELRPVDVEKELESFDYSVFSRPPQFASTADFLNGINEQQRVVTFNYDNEAFTYLPGYAPAKDRTQIDTSLRGSHAIVAYVGAEEDLDFRFSFRDINRHKDDDEVSITVSRGSEQVAREVVPDDGITAASGEVKAEREYTLHLTRPGRGVYKIRLKTTDDTFLTSIDTQQHRFYFEGSIYLTDNDEYRSVLGNKELRPTTLYTQGSRITVRTSHPAGRQTFRVGKLQRTLRSLQEPLAINDLIGITQLTFPKNDVLVEGGSFAFSRSAFFAADLRGPKKLEETNEPIDAFDYIIAERAGGRSEKNLFVATATIAEPELKRQDGEYRFLLNVPGLSESKRRLRIYEITIEFRGNPITPAKVFSKVRSALNKIL